MRVIREWFGAALLSAATATHALAHEGHAHPSAGIALWQIIAAAALGVAVYVAVSLILKRRARRRVGSNERARTDDAAIRRE